MGANLNPFGKSRKPSAHGGFEALQKKAPPVGGAFQSQQLGNCYFAGALDVSVELPVVFWLFLLLLL